MLTAGLKLTTPTGKIFGLRSGDSLHSIIPYVTGEEKTGAEKSFLVSLPNHHAIARIFPVTNDLIKYAGDGSSDRKQGLLLNASFESPRGMCADPTRKNHYFIADGGSIRCSDGVNISLVEESLSWDGYWTGIGAGAGFGKHLNICISSTGRTIYVADKNNCAIRAVDVKTGGVCTVAGDHGWSDRDGKGTATGITEPKHLVLYRSPSTKPDSVLFISANHKIRRFDIETTELTTMKWNNILWFDAGALACTSNGTLIVSCSRANTLWAINPVNGDGERLTDTDTTTTIRPDPPSGMSIDETAHAVWTVSIGRIECVTVPPHLFW
jgi:hypothetical protein